MNNSYTRSCPICDSNIFQVVMPLAPTPLGDVLSVKRPEALALSKYPLDVALCEECGHLFLPLVVRPESSYENYFFASASSPGLQDQFLSIVEILRAKIPVMSPSIVDIGSNDGTWLKLFQNFGCKVIGVEASSRMANRSNESGTRTLCAYFNADVVEEIRQIVPRVDLITMNFMLANVPDLQDFFLNLSELADNQTLISILTGYHPVQFRNAMFDYVYHEHVSYFTVKDLVALANKSGFIVEDASFVPLKGGSINVLLRKSKSYELGTSANTFVQYERWQGVTRPSVYSKLMNLIDKQKLSSLNFLQMLNKSMENIFCYGVSHSVTTLNYQFDLVNTFTGAVDDNMGRWSLYTPGTGLLIESPETLVESKDSLVVVAAWQHDFRIKKRLESLGYRGDILQPLPYAELVSGHSR